MPLYRLAIALILLKFSVVAISEEPPLLKSSGNAATVYIGKLISIEDHVVTVQGFFITDSDKMQAIKCKLSYRRTKGIRYSDAGALEAAILGGPRSNVDANEIKNWVGHNVKVGQLGNDCAYFKLADDHN